MPTFARRPSTVSSLFPVELPQNYMVEQQRQQISELQFDKYPNPQSFLVWKIRFKTQVTTCSDFPSDAMLWIKEVEMVDSLDELKSSRWVCWKEFSAAREDCLCSEQDHPKFLLQEEGLEEEKAQKEDRFLRGRQIAFMIYDYFRVTGAHGLCWITLSYSSWW